MKEMEDSETDLKKKVLKINTHKLYRKKVVLPVMPCTKRPLPIILSGDPKKSNFLYCHGRSVIIRNLREPKFADVYGDHTDIVTVAKYSPNGRLVASADASGNLKIWGNYLDFHPLEYEYCPFRGVVKDLAWAPDGQCIFVAGKSSGSSGKLISVEDGSTLYGLKNSKMGNVCCDFRPRRTYRFAAGSEDHSISFFEGPPYRSKFSKFEHHSVVNCVRFSPDGSFLASAGFDGKVLIYDAKTGVVNVELGPPAHSSVVTGLSWGENSHSLLTSSEDGTCKLWDIMVNKPTTEFTFGSRKGDQQLACLWQDGLLLSISANGCINYLDKDDPTKPAKVLRGHSDMLTSMAVRPKTHSILTAGSDGLINYWNYISGENKPIEGPGHQGCLNDMLQDTTPFIYTCGNDFSIRQINAETQAYTKYLVKLNQKPIALGHLKNGILAVACQKKLFLIANRAIVFAMPINYHATCLGTNPFSNQMCVGGHDLKVHFYKANEQSLEHQYNIEHDFPINCLAFSPDYKHLVVCDSGGKVCNYSQKQGKYVKSISWSLTNDVVSAVAWSPNSSFIATASMDYSITLQSAYNPIKQVNIVNAHGRSIISRLSWLDDSTLVSIGQDGNTNLWSVET